MTASASPTSMPQSVRITGWIAAVVGAIETIGLAFAAAFWGLMTTLAADLPVPPVAEFAIAQVRISVVIAPALAVAAAVFTVAGVALTRGREWARRTLVVLLWLLIAWAAGCAILGPVVQSRLLHEMGGWQAVQAPEGVRMLARFMPLFTAIAGVVVAVQVSAATYLVIRWLRSRTVRGACSH